MHTCAASQEHGEDRARSEMHFHLERCPLPEDSYRWGILMVKKVESRLRDPASGHRDEFTQPRFHQVGHGTETRFKSEARLRDPASSRGSELTQPTL